LGDSSTYYEQSKAKPQTEVDVRRIVEDGPLDKGFDYSYVFPAGIQSVPYAVYENDRWQPLQANSELTLITQASMDQLTVKLDKEEGLGDSNWDPHLMGPLLAHRACDYIRKQGEASAPFFLYYCSLAVHKPHTPSDSLAGQRISGSTPVAHLDLVKELDVQVGMMMDALKEQGLYENTLFIFTSDNGGLGIPSTLETGHQPSDIYRGSKNQIYEGGHRVPFILSWPNEIPAGHSAAPILGLDIMATLAELVEVSLETKYPIDSKSLFPLIEKPEKLELGHLPLLVQGGTGREVAIIQDNWKLIIQLDKKDKTDQTRYPVALFDLSTNPTEAESGNLIHAPSQARRVATLLDTYNRYRDN
ncbi:MAG: sulfatase-like hydrolase/transferase, partial [Bacteroidota bacterium]